MCDRCDETPNDGHGSGMGGNSSRREAEYRDGLYAMYDRLEEERKHKEILNKLDKLIDK